MMSLADQWGWFGDEEGKNLEKLLKQMIDESDPKLPVGYLNADEVLLNNFSLLLFLIIRIIYIKCLGPSAISIFLHYFS